MSDAQPAAATPPAPATPPPAAAPKAAPKTVSPLFRVDDSEETEDGTGKALREGREKAKKVGVVAAAPAPARDPETGKFTGGDGAQGKPAAKDTEGTLAPDFQAAEDAQKAAEEAPAEPPAPAAAPFIFKYGEKTYNEKELGNLLSRMDGIARASQRQMAEMTKVLENMNRGRAPESAERAAAEAGTEAPPAPSNPFAKSIIEDDALWDLVGKDVSEGQVRMGIGRAFQALEKRIADLIAYRDHTRNESLAGVNAYFSSLNSIYEMGQYIKGESEKKDEVTGEPLYSFSTGKKGRAELTDLTRFLHQHRLPRTADSFRLAYDSVIRPRRLQAATETTLRREASLDKSSEAAAAADTSLRSGARPPSPRDDSRPKTFVESLRDDLRTSGKKGSIFKT